MQKNWKDMLVGPTSSIRDTVALIDRLGSRAALIVDGDMHLLGILTDGDIRRGLLRGIGLDEQVTKIMNPAPQVCSIALMHSAQVRGQLESQSLLLMPVIDEGVLVDVIFAEKLQAAPRRDNAVFLMAGGFGKRLYPLTQDCPKPMLKVGDKPILELILQGFVDAGFHRFFISTHYLPEVIREHFGDGSRWGVSIRYIHENEPLGTGGALGLLPHEEIDQPIFLMNGDLLTRVDYCSLLDFQLRNGGAATLCVREYESQVPYGVIQSEGHRITRIVEKPVQRFFISAGIYVLSPELVRRVVPGESVDMPVLLEREIAAGRGVNMFPVHEYWLDIGRMDDFNRAQVEVRGS
ncbi:nucleotidyltransferase family protein [Jeongeupia naejangsanensis]|uniref:Nucleotidyltransferase family protein n=1 Tax=Jeongeupia naejangsanensis TaxID=613195 RepID=A0ABS2BQY9_9NEIS|nr:nucleotidyltransferase family protein [Jeongeupia naejangsanensis]MBM3117396.1 nucleotidyltransferase family protein [Jeongeupia naejangsanensis]